MDVFGASLEAILNTVQKFLSFEVDLGSVQFTLWQFLIAGLALSIIVHFIQRILE